MALQPGRKPTPPALRGIKGGKATDDTETQSPPENRRSEPLIPPKKLNQTQQHIWDTQIEPAWWIEQQDAMLAFMYVALAAEFVRSPTKMNTGRVTEMRRQMGELRLTSAEQARAGLIETPTSEDDGNMFDD